MNLVVARVGIESDAQGRYCLDDLHRASGGVAEHAPKHWLDLRTTQKLIALLSAGLLPIPAVSTVHRGKRTITYVCKELVHNYAMWISDEFCLKYICAHNEVSQGKFLPGTEPKVRTFVDVQDNNLVVAGVEVKKDIQGRYHLNALHRASGGKPRHRPSYWLKLKSTQRLRELLEKNEGCKGPYICEELAYSYALWVSAEFYLEVMHSLRSLVTSPDGDPNARAFLDPQGQLWVLAEDTLPLPRAQQRSSRKGRAYKNVSKRSAASEGLH